MLPLSEKEKVLDFIRKGEKNHTRRSPRCMARTDLPSVKLRRRREKCALVRRLASAARVMAAGARSAPLRRDGAPFAAVTNDRRAVA